MPTPNPLTNKTIKMKIKIQYVETQTFEMEIEVEMTASEYKKSLKMNNEQLRQKYNLTEKCGDEHHVKTDVVSVDVEKFEEIKIISGGFFDKEIAEYQAKLTIENVENGTFPNITGEIKVVKGEPIESYCGEMERWDVVELLTK